MEEDGSSNLSKMALAAVHSKVLALLLVLHCLLLLPLFVGFLCLTLVFYAILSVISSFTIILIRKREGWLINLNNEPRHEISNNLTF